MAMKHNISMAFKAICSHLLFAYGRFLVLLCKSIVMS